MADDPHVGLRMDGDKVVGVDHAADTAPANVEKVIDPAALLLTVDSAEFVIDGEDDDGREPGTYLTLYTPDRILISAGRVELRFLPLSAPPDP